MHSGLLHQLRRENKGEGMRRRGDKEGGRRKKGEKEGEEAEG